MKMRHFLASTCIVLIICGCAASPEDASEARDYLVWHEGDRIVYRGAMREAAVEEVANLLEARGDAVEWLWIESPGGDVMVGLDLGELVFEHGLNVKVFNTGCHSSCANYVFTAGRHKVIEDGSIVTWHGSALQRNWNVSTRRVSRTPGSSPRHYFKKWETRQEAFYERVGVDARITIVGQDLRCECVWTMSAEDMARFGVDNVEVPDTYTPTEISQISDDSSIEFLDLPEDVFDRIRSQ